MVRRRTKPMNSLYASVASSWAVVSLDVKVMELSAGLGSEVCGLGTNCEVRGSRCCVIFVELMIRTE